MLFFHSKRVYWRLLLFFGRLTRLVYARDDCSRCHCTSPDAIAAAADAGVHCQSSPTVQQKERLVVYPSSKCNSSCCYRPNASLSLSLYKRGTDRRKIAQTQTRVCRPPTTASLRRAFKPQTSQNSNASATAASHTLSVSYRPTHRCMPHEALQHSRRDLVVAARACVTSSLLALRSTQRKSRDVAVRSGGTGSEVN